MATKEFVPNKGWLKIMEMKRAQAEAKRIRLKKEEAYRYMVGSVRELHRKQFEAGLTMRRR